MSDIQIFLIAAYAILAVCVAAIGWAGWTDSTHKNDARFHAIIALLSPVWPVIAVVYLLAFVLCVLVTARLMLKDVFASTKDDDEGEDNDGCDWGRMHHMTKGETE